jgi:hypothetical protein
LRKLGFEPLSTDLCIFKHRIEMLLLIIYVDDMLISAPTRALIALIREALKEHFELKELGDVKQFLGITISRDRANRRIFIVIGSLFEENAPGIRPRYAAASHGSYANGD